MTHYHSLAFAVLALFIMSLPAQAQTIGPRDIEENAVLSGHIKKGNVRSSDIKNRTITKKDQNKKLAGTFLAGS